MVKKTNHQKEFERLKKKVGFLGEEFFKKFDREIKIKKSSNVKNIVLEVLMKALPAYKTALGESTKADILGGLKDNLVKVIGSEEEQMNRIIGESLIEVFKSVDSVLEHSINDRQMQMGLTQLMTTYSNILNTNKLKMDNKEVVNEIVTTIQNKLNNIGSFWIYNGTKCEYFNDLLSIIILSVKVNRFEEEWGLEIVQDMIRDNIERYSSFIPQGMIIAGLELLVKDKEITDNVYNQIVNAIQETLQEEL